MKQSSEGLIFDVMRYAIHDGPGIRTTVFLKGCPLRCTWCANPESQNRSPEISHSDDKCLLCGGCEAVCPNRAVTLIDDRHHIDRTICQACGNCVENCPSAALALLGKKITVEALFEEIVVDRLFWERSGGGVTLSGGEPLIQLDFCKDLLEKCRKHYIFTAVETCLYVPLKTLDAVLPYLDLVICDLKIIDDKKHKTLTGASNRRIKQNLRYIIQEKQKECLIRMPLIPGLNDGVGDMQALADFLGTLDKKIKFEIMPYHRLGEPKYKRLGRKYALSNPQPSDSDLALVRKAFESMGIVPIQW